MLRKKSKELNELAFYKGEINTAEATELLKDAPNNSYLLRYSTRAGNEGYWVVIKKNGEIFNLPVQTPSDVTPENIKKFLINKFENENKFREKGGKKPIILEEKEEVSSISQVSALIDSLNSRYRITFSDPAVGNKVFYLAKNDKGIVKPKPVGWYLENGRAVFKYETPFVNADGKKINDPSIQKRIDDTLRNIEKNFSINLGLDMDVAPTIDLNNSQVLSSLRNSQESKNPSFATKAMGRNITSVVSTFLTDSALFKTNRQFSQSDAYWEMKCRNDFPTTYQKYQTKVLAEEKRLREALQKETKTKQGENAVENKVESKPAKSKYVDLYQIFLNSEYIAPAQNANESAHRKPLPIQAMAIFTMVKQPTQADSKYNLNQLSQVLLQIQREKEEFYIEEQHQANPSFQRYQMPSDEELEIRAWKMLWSVSDKHGRTPLYWAHKNGRRDILDKYYQIESKRNEKVDSTNILGDAIASFQPINELEKKFQASVKKLNPQDNFNRWLSIAAEIGNLDAVKFLVEKGADPAKVHSQYNGCQSNQEKFNALQIAAMHGQLDVVKYFVEESKTDVAAYSKHGTNALHLAVLYEQRDVAEYLLTHIDLSQKQAFIDAAAANKTPLHIAMRSKDVEMVKLLQDHKATPGLKDNRGMTTTQTSARYQGADFEAILKEKVETKMTEQEALQVYAFEGLAIGLVSMLEQKPSLATLPLDTNGNGLLHYMVAGSPDIPIKKGGMHERDEYPVKLSQDRLNAIQTLVQEYKVNINQANNEGITPLAAVISVVANLDVVLSDSKKDSKDSKPIKDLTPLNAELALIQKLVQQGAKTDIQIKDEKGQKVPLKQFLDQVKGINSDKAAIVETILRILNNDKLTFEMPKEAEQKPVTSKDIDKFIEKCGKEPDQKQTITIRGSA